MSLIKAAVYDAPAPGLPTLAVLILPNGEVSARAVPDVTTGEQFLNDLVKETSAKMGVPFEVRRR